MGHSKLIRAYENLRATDTRDLLRRPEDMMQNTLFVQLLTARLVRLNWLFVKKHLEL